MKLYFDSSAMVKLVQREAESEALRRYLRRHKADERVSSDLERVEVVRSDLGGGPRAVAHARRQLARLHLVSLDVDLLNRAATLAPASVLVNCVWSRRRTGARGTVDRYGWINSELYFAKVARTSAESGAPGPRPGRGPLAR